jgi:hypothetical protein
MELMQAGKVDEACVKLDESQKLDPAMGTQYRLAECFEKAGKTASAWTNFIEVADKARAAGQEDREKAARERADALKPALSKMTVAVSPPAASIAGLEVFRDGKPVGKGQLGIPLPVDPGKHVIEARAAGYKPWQTEIDVGAGAAAMAVEVPALEVDPAAAAPPPPGPADGPVAPGGGEQAPDQPAPSNTRRTVGLVTGAVGVVAIGVGAVFGILAIGKKSSAKDFCDDQNVCEAEGIDKQETGVAFGNVSTVAIIAGAALVGTGAVLFLTAPKAKPAQTGWIAPQAPRLGLGPAHASFACNW